MSELPLWGSLQKAQDDAETIEEAINRIVAEHNDSPESHLDTGQSLDEHKKEDVIDHPPFSVVPDKISPELPGLNMWMTDFATRDAFNAGGTGSVVGSMFGQVLQSGSSAGNTYGLYLNDTEEWFFDAYSYNMFTDFWALFLGGSNLEYWFGVNIDGAGFYDPGDGANGWGFKFGSDNKLRAVYQEMGESLISYEITGVSVGAVHKYSTKFYPGDRLEFYVDDTLRYTATTNLPNTTSADVVFGVSAKRVSGSGSARMELMHLYLEREAY